MSRREGLSAARGQRACLDGNGIPVGVDTELAVYITFAKRF